MSAGTLTLTNNSTAVTGTGTAFTTDLKPNDFIVAVVGGVTYTLGVQTITNNTAIVLNTAYTGPAATGAAWTAIPNATLVGITATLAEQVSRAIRGLNLDKTNWQQVYSGTGNITVTLPDGSTFTGPAWNSISDLVNNKASKGANSDITSLAGLTTPLSVAQGGTGANTKATAWAALATYGTASGTAAQGNDARLSTIDGKTGGTVSGPSTFSDLLTTSGGVNVTGPFTVDMTKGVRFKGLLQGTYNSDITFNTSNGSGSDSFVGYQTYYWYQDGWITGIKRGGSTDSLSYAIYYNGASTSGQGREWKFNRDGTATGQGAWNVGSDGEHKSEIEKVPNPLSAVCSWAGVTYKMKDAGYGVGLIAQDIEPWCSTAVRSYGERKFSDGTVIKNFKTLDVSGVSAAYHTESIKALFDLIDLAMNNPEECKKRIDEVKSGIIEGWIK